MAQLAGNAHWAEPSPLFAHKARPTPLKCKNEYPVLPLGEETAVQAVVGSIVWAFRRHKKPRSLEMSARGYALHSVCPQLSFRGESVPLHPSSVRERFGLEIIKMADNREFSVSTNGAYSFYLSLSYYFTYFPHIYYVFCRCFYCTKSP